MADLVGNRVLPHVERKQLAHIRAGRRFAISGAKQVAVGLVGKNGDWLQNTLIMLAATDLLHLIIIV